MTTIRFVGDVHGKWYAYEQLIRSSPFPTIQVGDFGCGFNNSHWPSIEKLHTKGNHNFIRGNHDDPARCKQMPGFINDGTIIDNMMFMGGAWSIDAHNRTVGIDWWEDEEISYTDFSQLIETYNVIKPEIVVTHDFPCAAAAQMFFQKGEGVRSVAAHYSTRTATAFQHMFELHQPRLWIGGHWHYNVSQTINGTRFICIAELEYCDVNTETFEIK